MNNIKCRLDSIQYDSLPHGLVRFALLLTFTSLLLASFFVKAQLVELDGNANQHRFYSELSYFSTDNQNLQFASIFANPSVQWTTHSNQMPDFGFTDSSYWFKVNFTNNEPSIKSYIFEYEYPQIDDIEVYVVDYKTGELSASFYTGDQRVFESRPIKLATFAFPLLLEANKTVSVYIKISTKGTMIVPLSVSTEQAFYERNFTIYIVYAFVFSAMFLTAVYNLFIYWRTRESVFLTFSMFAFSMAFLVTTQSGVAFQYFWPSSLPWFDRLVPLAAALATFMHLIFSLTFLTPKNKIKDVFSLLVLVSAIVLVFGSFFSYSIHSNSFELFNNMFIFNKLGNGLHIQGMSDFINRIHHD